MQVGLRIAEGLLVLALLFITPFVLAYPRKWIPGMLLATPFVATAIRILFIIFR